MSPKSNITYPNVFRSASFLVQLVPRRTTHRCGVPFLKPKTHALRICRVLNHTVFRASSFSLELSVEDNLMSMKKIE